MIAQAVIDEIEKLLAEGRLSRRAIAIKVGVSRTVVTQLAAKHYNRPARASRRACLEGPLRRRCPSCGYAVPLPCVYCRAQAYRRRSGCA